MIKYVVCTVDFFYVIRLRYSAMKWHLFEPTDKLELIINYLCISEGIDSTEILKNTQ